MIIIHLRDIIKDLKVQGKLKFNSSNDYETERECKI